jgi:hypothetical protein
MAVSKLNRLKAAFKRGKSLSKWLDFGSGLNTNKDSWKLRTHTVKCLRFLNFARNFEH